MFLKLNWIWIWIYKKTANGRKYANGIIFIPTTKEWKKYLHKNKHGIKPREIPDSNTAFWFENPGDSSSTLELVLFMLGPFNWASVRSGEAICSSKPVAWLSLPVTKVNYYNEEKENKKYRHI